MVTRRKNQLGICIKLKPGDTWWFFIIAPCQEVTKKSAAPGEPTNLALPLTTAELNKRNEQEMEESHKKVLQKELDEAAKSMTAIRRKAFHASPKKATKGRGRGKGRGKGGASSASKSKPKAKAKGKTKVSKSKAKEMKDEEPQEEEEATKDEEQEESEGYTTEGSDMGDIPNTQEEDEEAWVSLKNVTCRLATVHQNLTQKLHWDWQLTGRTCSKEGLRVHSDFQLSYFFFGNLLLNHVNPTMTSWDVSFFFTR